MRPPTTTLLGLLQLAAITLIACASGPAADSTGATPASSPESTPILMVFWASWCQACGKNLYEIDRIHRQLQRNQGPPRFALLAVNIDDDIHSMQSALNRYNLRVQNFHDLDGSIAQQWRVTSLPELLVIQDGALLMRGEGSARDWRRIWQAWVWPQR